MEHMELLTVVWQVGWEGSLGENGCTCMAESLHCPPETVIALFVNQQYPNTKLKVLKKTSRRQESAKGRQGWGITS